MNNLLLIAKDKVIAKQDEVIFKQQQLIDKQAERLEAIEAIIGCTYPNLNAGQQSIMQVEMIGIIFQEE